MNLLEAFSIQEKEIVALVGGGGKTSLMFALAEAISGRVVLTTTTRIFAAQIKLATAVSIYTPESENNWVAWLADLDARLTQYGRCLVVGEVQGEKAFGVPPDLPAKLIASNLVDAVIVEADGSRMRPIKAPAAHEPVIPAGTTLLVPVVGIDALNGRLANIAHRPDQVKELLGRQETDDAPLTPEEVARLLASKQGGLKHAPDNARVIPFINKVESAEQLVNARQIAHSILRNSPLPSPISQVVIGAIRSDQPIREVHSRVTAVILAAGQAKRMGQTKQLLPWGETTLLGQTIRNAKQSAAHEVLVVSGHDAPKVEAVAQAEGVRTMHNPHYATGEMLSSLQTAVRQLPSSVTAVLVILADQPMIEAETINQLLFAFWQGKGHLIAPQFQGKRGNPVLIGATHFAELLALPPGDAPRTLLNRHPTTLIEVHSGSILVDLDTLAEYGRWQNQPPTPSSQIFDNNITD